MTGRPNPVSDPDCCMVVVLDVQNDFCHEDGATAHLGQDVRAAQAIVPEIQALATCARSRDVPVVWVRTTHSDWFDTPAWVERGRAGTTLDVTKEPVTREGSWGAEFYGVRPRPEDLVLTKHRYSAFAYTPLELVLHARRRDTILFGGTRTDVCVEYTAVHALIQGFYPVLVRECVAADGEKRQEDAFAGFEGHIGAIISRAEIEDAWMREQQVEEVA